MDKRECGGGGNRKGKRTCGGGAELHFGRNAGLIKIMIVEDELVSRTVRETRLKREGHEGVSMPDGR